MSYVKHFIHILKVVIRNHKSKDRQCNNQKNGNKNTNNDP